MAQLGRRLILGVEHLQVLRRLAEEMAPEECCGVLLGRVLAMESTVDEVLQGKNVADDRRRRYDIDVPTLLLAHRRARETGRDIVGYYHSHPASPPRPSATDRQYAWPETSYLILGLPQDGGIAARSWRLGQDGETLEEEELVVR